MIIWKKRIGRTPRNLAQWWLACLRLHLPGPEVSLDNPESPKIPFGVAVAVAVVLYTVRQAWGSRTAMRFWKKLAGETVGAEIAEAAIVLPLVFMLIAGNLLVRASLQHLRHDHPCGARRCAGRDRADCATLRKCASSRDQVATRVAQALQASKLDPTQVTPLLPNPAMKDCVTRAPVIACAVSEAEIRQICFQPNVRINDPTTGPPACGVSVSFQYPYQFYLPFTSLNNQLIQLKANVQTTGED